MPFILSFGRLNGRVFDAPHLDPSGLVGRELDPIFVPDLSPISDVGYRRAMRAPAPSDLSALAQSFLPQILMASEGRPLLTVSEAAVALASLGSPGGSPMALRKLLHTEVLPSSAVAILGRSIRLHATGLAAWLAGDLRHIQRKRPARPAEPVSSPRRASGAPNKVISMLTPEDAHDFILPRGYRYSVAALLGE